MGPRVGGRVGFRVGGSGWAWAAVETVWGVAGLGSWLGSGLGSGPLEMVGHGWQVEAVWGVGQG